MKPKIHHLQHMNIEAKNMIFHILIEVFSLTSSSGHPIKIPGFYPDFFRLKILIFLSADRADA
jgi:hypothetical protein